MGARSEPTPRLSGGRKDVEKGVVDREEGLKTHVGGKLQRTWGAKYLSWDGLESLARGSDPLVPGRWRHPRLPGGVSGVRGRIRWQPVTKRPRIGDDSQPRGPRPGQGLTVTFRPCPSKPCSSCPPLLPPLAMYSLKQQARFQFPCTLPEIWRCNIVQYCRASNQGVSEPDRGDEQSKSRLDRGLGWDR